MELRCGYLAVIFMQVHTSKTCLGQTGIQDGLYFGIYVETLFVSRQLSGFHTPQGQISSDL